MLASNHPRASQSSLEEGFALVGLIVAIFIILLTLSVAAPTVARALRREREVEAVHRANEYVNAIRRYHLKTGAYPGSIDQLEKTNNIRYIRQAYNNPMTGKPDWRLIKVGESKTSVKGFFGQPLAGLASTGIGGSSTGTSSSSFGATGSSAGSSTSGASVGSTSSTSMSSAASGTGAGASDPGASSSFGGSASAGFGASGSAGGIGSSSSGAGGFGSSGSGSAAGGLGSQSASGASGSGSPFLGVGLPTPGAAIVVVNEQTTYPEWEFLYDPRIEQLKAKVNILGGGMSSSSSSSLGALSGSASSMPGTSSTSPVAPTSPTPSATPPQ